MKKQKKRISVSAAKSKGRELQKDIAKKISNLIGIPCGKDELIESREMGQVGCDVKLIGVAQELFKYSVECKRSESLNIYKSVEQAKANMKVGTDWLVISRRSNEDAIVTMSIGTFFELQEKIVSKKINKCPYCDKENCIKEVVFRNIENYGNNSFDLPCIYCNKMIHIFADREIIIYSVEKSAKSKNESDW